MELYKTPMEEQYEELKQNYKDCILLYRMGDFYEGFDEDAKIMSEVLNIALTSRSRGEVKRPMAGVPWHALDDYLYKLVSKGYKVAIAEQLETPDKTKKLVKRGVTKIVTPGTIDNLKSLPADENIYIASIVIDKDRVGLSYTDLLEGVINVNIFRDKNSISHEIIKKLQSINPAEIIIFNLSNNTLLEEDNLKVLSGRIEIINTRNYNLALIIDNLLKHLSVLNLKGFGINDLMSAEALSVSLLFDYIKQNQKQESRQISKIVLQNDEDRCVFDISTIRGLDLLNNSYNGSVNESLYGVMNKCMTAMGKRLLRNRLLFPYKSRKHIEDQLNIVKYFFGNNDQREKIRSILREISDLKRLSGKIGNKTINPKELIMLKYSLDQSSEVYNMIKTNDLLNVLIKTEIIDKCNELKSKLEFDLLDDPSYFTNHSDIFRQTYNEDVFRLRNLSHNSKAILAEMQKSEIAKTRISNLKIKYNRVFGYFIEISNSNASKVPDNYIKKQTLVNCERYITEELKQIEIEILNAEEELNQLEAELYSEYLIEIEKYILYIQDLSDFIAFIDVSTNLAHIAKLYKYIIPRVSDEKTIILESRHPVVENLLPSNKEFIPNDYDSNNDQTFMLITGPNMSGKSTYIRQIALIQIMFQMGSFVPATKAEICIADKIYTRIGAADNLLRGESTFMVEMNEVANILNNASKNSLIVLDEVGRGTSTYDGVAIAWAISEYIVEKLHARTLFATHYHELVRMQDIYKEIKNYHISVEEVGHEVFFLYKIENGAIDKSYGIHVAKLAGVPKEIVQRSEEILKDLENKGLFEIKNNINNYKRKIVKNKNELSLKQEKLL